MIAGMVAVVVALGVAWLLYTPQRKVLQTHRPGAFEIDSAHLALWKSRKRSKP